MSCNVWHAGHFLHTKVLYHIWYKITDGRTALFCFSHFLWNEKKQFLSLFRQRKTLHLMHFMKARLVQPSSLHRPLVPPQADGQFHRFERLSRALSGWCWVQQEVLLNQQMGVQLGVWSRSGLLPHRSGRLPASWVVFRALDNVSCTEATYWRQSHRSYAEKCTCTICVISWDTCRAASESSSTPPMNLLYSCTIAGHGTVMYFFAFLSQRWTSPSGAAPL